MSACGRKQTLISPNFCRSERPLSGKADIGNGPSLAQQFLTDDKCKEQNNCPDDNKLYSVHQKEGDKLGEAFLM